MREWYPGEEGGLIHKYLLYRVELKVLTWAEGKDFEVFKGEADESVQDKLKSCCGNS